MRFLVRVLVSWLPLAVASTGMCLLVYATVQQNYRQSLNDPQIQMAEDAAKTEVMHGVTRSIDTAVPGAGKVIDIAHSAWQMCWAATHWKRMSLNERKRLFIDKVHEVALG